MSDRVIEGDRPVQTADPFRMDFGDQAPAQRQAVVPMGGVAAGPGTDMAMARIVTAQHVGVKRHRASILKEANALAAVMGPKLYYSWQVNNRASGKKETIEGPSIQCAMAAVSLYGNCSLEAFPAQETPTHWTFLARFIDYETGLTFMRSFQQRKSQGLGKMDADRALDLVYQVGQSKALRNVIVGALPWLCDEMVEAAKQGMLSKIEHNPDGFRTRLKKWFDDREIDIARVERQVARTFDKWRVQDIAAVVTQVQAVSEGFSDADDLWPVPVPGDATNQPVQETAGEGGTAQVDAAAKKPRTPKADAKKAAEGEDLAAKKPAQDAPPPPADADPREVPPGDDAGDATEGLQFA